MYTSIYPYLSDPRKRLAVLRPLGKEDSIMGSRDEARCLDCGHRFELESGGGFMFHLLTCDTCGKNKGMDIDGLGELRLRYLKGMSEDWRRSSYDFSKNKPDLSKIEPIASEEYYKGVEGLAGTCKCGGKFTFDASPRCPKCRSTRINGGKNIIMYD
jgi:Zn finger protein HypA/HybF involved in hydrogenase expression